MAAAATTGLPMQISASNVSTKRPATHRRRRIDPQAGRALEKLGHAIEYLTDEFAHDGKTAESHDPRVEAIQLLMELNRQIYYECPVMSTFTERLRAFFHISATAGQR